MPDGSFAQDAWTAAIELARGEGRLSDSQTAFVRLAKPLAIVDDRFLIGVATEFTRNLINTNVAQVLTEQLSAIIGREMTLDISVDRALSEEKVTPASSSNHAPSQESSLRSVATLPSPVHAEENVDNSPMAEPSEIFPAPSHSHAVPEAVNTPQNIQRGHDTRSSARLNPRYTFETFVTGESNRFAHATALAVSELPGSTYNPLFLYSDSGMGKTHLLHAIGNSVQQMFPNKKVLYVSAEEFTNAFINALANGQMHNFKDQFRTVDVLLIDDIQFLSGRDRSRTLEEFFHTFNALINSSKQIVITSDVAPNLLVDFEDRMISRFKSGITAAIDLPNLETRIAILNRKAMAEGLVVPRDVVEFIASRITSNVREMEGALRRIRAFADLTKQEISLQLAESQLKDMISDPSSIQVTAGMIVAQVSNYFNVPLADLKSPTRTRTLTQPRHVAMYLCRELTDLSLPKIAEEFNRRDHTTVMNAVRKVEALMAEKQTIFNQVSELTTIIKNAARDHAQLSNE
ncbi:chromosomal replication initiator protein DnaA [Arcanobacterium phocisimile]|uniref:Chromosomal replication initiator protein DnaA n=1 Tax=Arcanobacterium phocisimile TaxID=1302235 RepID=A0ABX7IGD7_9ACTO|nr:chromosomal replication initiator protein DnaA [Arcanobacterium phocisimile]QRV02186.1 chromosomal replication initiator protein DnaA [Arcanobacterium phocisimile]